MKFLNFWFNLNIILSERIKRLLFKVPIFTPHPPPPKCSSIKNVLLIKKDIEDRHQSESRRQNKIQTKHLFNLKKWNIITETLTDNFFGRGVVESLFLWKYNFIKLKFLKPFFDNSFQPFFYVFDLKSFLFWYLLNWEDSVPNHF